jgi:hypothetical protein
MAFGTEDRTGSELLMTFDALRMKRIGFGRHFIILIFGRVMAVFTGFRFDRIVLRLVAGRASQKIRILIRRVMMAIVTGKAETRIRGMGFVVEQNIAGNTFEHDSDWLIRLFRRKRGIAEQTDDEQDNGDTDGDLQILLGGHVSENPFTVEWLASLKTNQ